MVIIFAFLDLGKNISFSDTLVGTFSVSAISRDILG
jgi:hypothetical protein